MKRIVYGSAIAAFLYQTVAILIRHMLNKKLYYFVLVYSCEVFSQLLYSTLCIGLLLLESL